MLLRDGRYSYQEHSYVHSGTECLPFALSTLGEAEGGGGSKKRLPLSQVFLSQGESQESVDQGRTIQRCCSSRWNSGDFC